MKVLNLSNQNQKLKTKTGLAEEGDITIRGIITSVRKMDPRPILFWILVFDDQHNQIGLMNL